AKAVEGDLMHRMGVTVAREVGDIPLGIGMAYIAHAESTAFDKDQLLAHPIGEPLAFLVGEASAAGSREQNSEKQSDKGLSKSHDHVCASSPVRDGGPRSGHHAHRRCWWADRVSVERER